MQVKFNAGLLSFGGSLLAAIVVAVFELVPLIYTFILILCLVCTFLVFCYWKTKKAIGFKGFWLPLSNKRLYYHLEEVKEEYFVMGVTLHSMLQITGVGVDIETFSKIMPKNLKIKLLILDPDSPYFLERISEAHPNHKDLNKIYSEKRRHQSELISKIYEHFGAAAEIRLYYFYPAWWVQIVDRKTIYFATQTRDSFIGQTYPFGIPLIKEYDSDLFWTISKMLDSIWKYAKPVKHETYIKSNLEDL